MYLFTVLLVSYVESDSYYDKNITLRVVAADAPSAIETAMNTAYPREVETFKFEGGVRKSKEKVTVTSGKCLGCSQVSRVDTWPGKAK